MSELVVSFFRDQQRAPEVLNELRRREYQWVEELNNALVLTTNGSVPIKAEISVDPTGCEPHSWVKLWSSLLSGTLFIQGAHVLVEAAESLACSEPRVCQPTYSGSAGQLLRWWRDSVGLSDDFRRDLAAALSSSGSAIFMFFNSTAAAELLPHLGTFCDTIVHATLMPEQDEEVAEFIALQNTLEAELVPN